MHPLIKKWGPWIPIVLLLWGAVHSATEHALMRFANSSLVMRDLYLQNQIAQDRRILELEEQVKELERRLDQVEQKIEQGY